MAEYYNLKDPKTPEIPCPLPKPNKKCGLLSELLQLSEVREDTSSAHIDSLDTFINDRPFKIEDTPLEWWCRLEQRSRFPRLSRMALDLFSIPPESAEPERAFSGARRTASWDRLRMSCQSLERVECIGNWLREGLIVPSSNGGLGLARDPTPDEDILVHPALLEDGESLG